MAPAADRRILGEEGTEETEKEEGEMKRRCHSCSYWGDKFIELPRERWMEECKRNPPVLIDENNEAKWPLTYFFDYCYQWNKLKEENRKMDVKEFLSERKFCLSDDVSLNFRLMRQFSLLTKLNTTVSGEVNKDLDFIIVGTEQNERLKRAIELGIRKVPQKDFIETIWETVGEKPT